MRPKPLLHWRRYGLQTQSESPLQEGPRQKDRQVAHARRPRRVDARGRADYRLTLKQRGAIDLLR
jgi:hypothetical protein